MKKYFLIFIVLSTILYVSCEKSTKLDDNEPPVVSDIKINDNDTIVLAVGDTIYINRNPLAPDTLVMGGRLKFSGRFTDDNALSTYRIMIDSIPSSGHTAKDTVYQKSRVWSSIFGESDITIYRQQDLLLDRDTIERRNANASSDSLIVKEGDYNVIITCLDMSGKRDSVIHKVKLLRKQTIRELYGKKKGKIVDK